jgi:hypothetical protein
MVLDLTGEIFGKLTVVGEDKGTPKGYNYWRCECECGGKSSVRSSYLRSGHTKSCGCLRSTVSKELNTTHGLADNRIYNVYIGMKARCYNKNSGSYPNYGGRGITVCPYWLESFENFYNDIGVDYEEGLQLDRIDNDLGYSKENCRWATPQQNQMNKGYNINASSKYKGVSWNKRSTKWLAKIKKNGKVHYIGTFTLETEAALAYNKKALELNGEYAYLNKV